MAGELFFYKFSAAQHEPKGFKRKAVTEAPAA